MFKITKLALLLSAGLLGANLCAASTVEFVPGKYIGEANGRNGPMKVEVTVDKNKITNIFLTVNPLVYPTLRLLNFLRKLLIARRSK